MKQVIIYQNGVTPLVILFLDFKFVNTFQKTPHTHTQCAFSVSQQTYNRPSTRYPINFSCSAYNKEH